jgi:nucleoside-diphosphate-sugar epimerase
MIFYNGTTGSLGRYFTDAVKSAGVPATALRSRLEDRDGFREELSAFSGQFVHGPVYTFIHFAAKVSVPWCEANAFEARKTNVTDTLEATRIFVDFCRKSGAVPKIIYVSSAHLYARNEEAIHESDPLLPRSVYAKTKLEAEKALLAFSKVENFDFRIVRVFGLVAPIQPENYILHAMLKRAREKRVRDIPGLSGVRDYLDSRDVCRALVRIVNLPDGDFSRVCPDRILNLSAGEGVTIRALAEASIRATYPESEAEALVAEMTEAPPRADDVPRIVGAVDRFLALFGDNPRSISLDETIRDALAVRA